MSSYGRILRNTRLLSDVTIVDCAKAIDRSPEYLGEIERGKRAPLKPEQTRKLARFLGADPTPLLVAAVEERGTVHLDVRESSFKMTLGALLAGAWDLLTDAEVMSLTQALAAMRLPDGTRRKSP